MFLVTCKFGNNRSGFFPFYYFFFFFFFFTVDSRYASPSCKLVNKTKQSFLYAFQFGSEIEIDLNSEDSIFIPTVLGLRSYKRV